VVTLRLLGGLSLDGPSGPVTGPAAQRKRLALLALLALAPGRRLSRDKASAYLWPESNSERARHQLSSALYEIRNAVGEDAILAVGDELRLNADAVRTDAAEFEAAFAAGDAARAVSVYRGPLLDGFFLSDAPEFERWVDGERERIAAGYARALEALAETAEAQRDVPAAVVWWKARAAHDPYDSRVALRLVQALDAGGNRASALQHAAIHAALLRDEFGVEPDPELVALAERLRSTPRVGVESEAGQRSGDAAAADGTGYRAQPRHRAEEGSPGPSAPAAHPPGARLDSIDAGPGRPARQSDAGKSSAPTQRRRVRAVRRWALSLGLPGLGALAVVVTAFWMTQASPGSGARRVVVAPFENRTGDPALDLLGGMAADWIAGGLSRAAGLDVVLTSGSASVPERPGRHGAGSLDAIAAFAHESGTVLIVSGAYYRHGDSVRFHTHVTDGGKGTLLRSLEPITGALSDPGNAVEEIGRRATAAVAVALDTRLASLGKLASPPTNYEAYHACLEGVDPFLDSDWPVAIRHFERALELDSGYLFPRIHIAYVHHNMGDLATADSIVRILNRSRARMTPFELGILDLLSAYLAEDPVGAYEAAMRAATVSAGSPPNVQWGGEALRLNRPREAIRILSAIDPEAAPIGGWPLYWTTLTGAYHQLGRHRAELRHARRARALHPNDSWPLQLEARALAALGRSAALEALVLERMSLPAQHDPRPGEMMTAIGQELRVHGRADASRDWFERAAERYRGQPSGDSSRTADRQGLAFALLALDRTDEAERLFDELATADPENVAFQGALGVLAAKRADAAEARRIGSQLAGLTPPYRTGDQLLWSACIAAHAGQLAGALSLLREAAGRGARFEHTHFCIDPLRDHPPFRDYVRAQG
jgi:DNA-binding SARP family transcriptional activator/TolB-like protein